MLTMNAKNELLWRLYGVLVAFVLVGGLILYKVIQINVIEGEKWRNKGESDYRKYLPVEADRGSIISADGRPLAVSQPFFDIRIDLVQSKPSLFNQGVDSLAWYIVRHLNTEYSAAKYAQLLREGRKKGNRSFLVKRNATFEDLEMVKTFPILKEGQLKGGLVVEKNSNNRLKPFGDIASRTIGVYRADKPVGLESFFHKELAGAEGLQLKQKIGHNEWVPVHDVASIAPQRGRDIVTTLDMHLQDITHTALIRACVDHEADYGTAILMEVETGAVRALANLGKSESGGYWESLNYAVLEAQEPGSTFKLASVMAMLEDGAYAPESLVNLERGKAKFYGVWMNDSEMHNIESATLAKSFEISSNVGISKLADKYYNNKENADKFTNRLKQFGMMQKSGVELYGEPDPSIKDAFDFKNGWSKTSIPWMSHGYELKMTPLQILAFYNGVANGGKKMKPYLVQEIRSGEDVTWRYEPVVMVNKMASQKSIAQVQHMLEGVILRGTGAHLKSKLVSLAAKTGTTKVDYYKADKQGHGYIASIAGYFPSQKPIYSCIVVVGKPRKGGFYGGHVAGPVFKEIAEKTYWAKIAPKETVNRGPEPELDSIRLPQKNIGYRADYLTILKGLNIDLEDAPQSDWVIVSPDKNTVAFSHKSVSRELVPNVVGMGLRDAIYLLEQVGLKVQVSGVGKVQSQSVSPGTPIRRQTIQLNLG